MPFTVIEFVATRSVAVKSVVSTVVKDPFVDSSSVIVPSVTVKSSIVAVLASITLIKEFAA